MSLKQILCIVIMVPGLSLVNGPAIADALLDFSNVNVQSSGDLELEMVLNIPADSGSPPVSTDNISVKLDQTELGVKACYPVTPIEPLDVALAIDTSGSMRRRLAIATEATRRLITRFPQSTRYALYSFNDEPVRQVAFDNNRSALRTALDNLRQGGKFTALYDTISMMLEDFDTTAKRRRMIVLLTDGKDENSKATLEQCLDLVGRKNIPVYSVAMGTKVEEGPLRTLASASRGNHFSLYNGSVNTLSDFFETLVSQMIPPHQKYHLVVERGAVPSTGKEQTLTVALNLGSNILQQSKKVDLPPQKPAASKTSGQDDRSKRPSPERPQSWLNLILIVIALAGIIALLALLLKKKKSGRVCPKCGEVIPDYLQECIHCSDTFNIEEQEPEPHLDTVPISQLSKTEPALFPAEDRLERTLVLDDVPCLLQMSGNSVVQTIDLSAITSITAGRKESCDVIVADRSVSTLHARISRTGDEFFIEDLGSTNGTFVNDRRVDRNKVRLSFGDNIRLGQTRLVFKLDQRKPF